MTTAKSPLYDRDILRLAAALYRWPLEDDYHQTIEQRSPVCGSIIRLGVDWDDVGQISRFGMDVQACALGQASAAILAANAIGLTRPRFSRHYQHCHAVLSDKDFDEAGIWPNMALLARAAPYPARHGAILLPYQALSRAFDARFAAATASPS